MSVRYRYHVTAPSLLYVLVTIFVGAGAINSQNNLLFLTFGLAAAAGLISGLVSGAMLMGLRATRIAPSWAAAEQPFTMTYEIKNVNRFVPAFAVVVEEVEGATAAGRWGRLISAPRSALLHLGPGESARLPVSVFARRRGEATLERIRLSSTFPFGVFRKSAVFAQLSTVPITPNVRRLKREAARALLSRSDAGISSVPVLGRGNEFYGLREYTPGDSPRMISWRATARTGTLVVRENTTTTAGTIWVVLNLNARESNDDPEKDPSERAITLAASLADTALDGGMDAGLSVPARSVVLAPGSGPRQRQLLMMDLARLNLEHAAQADRAAAPALSTRPDDSIVVVHAGDIDPTFAPAGARHVSARDLERLAIGTSTAAESRA